MPDPALLALVQHFTSPPPAIVRPAEMVDAEPFLSAYEAIAGDQDRAFAIWLAGEADVRHRTRLAVEADPKAFTPQMFDELIEPFERHMRRQRRITARLERRPPTRATLRLRSLWSRELAHQRRAYVAAAELVRFLRDMRDALATHNVAGAPVTWEPGPTTLAAMAEAEAGGLPRFASVDDLMADLYADD